jgi:hypothetical protein
MPIQNRKPALNRLPIVFDERIRETKQPPAKAGGFELWTESPDARRLNDTS